MRPPVVLATISALALLVGLYLLMQSGDPQAPAPPSDPERARSDPAAPFTPESAGDPVPCRELLGTGSIAGTVTRSDGPCVARVEVRRISFGGGVAVEDPDRWLGETARGPADCSTSSDASGRFLIDGLARGWHRVVAVAGDGVQGVLDVEIVEEGARAVASIRIGEGGCTLRGRALLSKDRPFRGTVGVAAMRGCGTSMQATDVVTALHLPVPCDEEGRFSVTGLSPGLVRPVLRRGDEFVLVGPPILLPCEDEVLLALDRFLRRVPGKVVGDGNAPVAGARISGRLRGTEVLQGSYRATTGADGTFDAWLGDGSSRVDVVAAGYSPVGEWLGQATKEVTIRLARPATIRGRVLDAAGKPAAGAVVKWILREGTHDSGAGAPAGEDGGFEITGVPPGTMLLYVLGGGWVSRLVAGGGELPVEPLLIGVAPGAVIEKELVATGTARARVRVVDASGHVVSGARVGFPVLPSRYGSQHSSALARGEGRRVVVSDAEGVCEFSDLLPGKTYWVRVQPPGGFEFGVQASLAAAGRATEIEVRIPPARAVECRLVFADNGEPVAGAILRVVPYRGSILADSWVTDGRGAARLGPLPTRKFELLVKHDGVARVPETVDVPAEPDTVVLRLDRGHVVRGRVVLPDGSPVSACEVILTSGIGESDPSKEYGIGARSALDGSFVITGAPPADRYRYCLSARLFRNDELQSALVDAEPGKEYTLVLEAPRREKPKGLVEVRVLGPDGQPALGGYAVFIGEWGSYGSRRATKWIGRGTVSHVFTEKIEKVSVEVHGSKSDSGPLGAARLGPVDFPGEALVIRLPREKTITGGVRDEYGRPVLGAKITTLPAHGEGATGDDGVFRIGGLGDFEYELVTKPPAPFAVPDPVRAHAGAADVAIVLTRGEDSVVTILDWKGEPVKGASLRICKVKGGPPVVSSHRCVSDEKGQVPLLRLDPGRRYHVGVWTPQDRDDLLATAIEDWRPADTVIRLERAFVITGEVRNKAGDSVRARVYLRRKGSAKWDWEWTRSGKFRFDKLREGEFEVKAVSPRPPFVDPDPPYLTVPAGRTGLVLVVD